MPSGHGCCERGKKIKRTGDYGEGKSRKPVFFSSPFPLSAARFLHHPLPRNPASLDLKQASVQGRELFSEIQVLKLFISLPYNVFPLLIMMLDASERRIKSPRSNWQSVFYLGLTFLFCCIMIGCCWYFSSDWVVSNCINWLRDYLIVWYALGLNFLFHDVELVNLCFK